MTFGLVDAVDRESCSDDSSRRRVLGKVELSEGDEVEERGVLMSDVVCELERMRRRKMVWRRKS